MIPTNTINITKNVFIDLKSMKLKGGKEKGSQDSGLPIRVAEGLAMIFSDVAFSKLDGKRGYDFSILLNGFFVAAGSLDGLKVSSPKESNARAILSALIEAKARGFSSSDFDGCFEVACSQGQLRLFC